MKKTCLIFAVLSTLAFGSIRPAIAAEPPAINANAGDVETVRQILAAAASLKDPAALHQQLSDAAGKIPDASLRDRLQKLLPDLEAAAARHQRVQQLIAEVAALHGVTATTPGGPDWLRALAGDSSMAVFDRLTSVDMNDRQSPHSKTYKLNENIRDEWLRHLEGMTDLENLDVANADIKGPGLKVVGTLTRLQALNLTLTPVTDEYLENLANLTEMKRLGLASASCNGTGCKYLGKMTKLENLNFHHTPVNDEGLKEIGKMTSLERLEIVHVFFTDEGAANLVNLKNLQRLQLGSRKASGKSIAFLRQLPKLRELDVHDLSDASEVIRQAAGIPTLTVLRCYVGPIKDDDVKEIVKLTNLEELILEGSKFTDSAVDSLLQLKKLKKLTLGGAKLTPAALEKLKAGLPGLVVVP